MPTPLSQPSSALRTFYRRKRRALRTVTQRCHAEAVAHAVVGHLAATDIVAAYYARDGEVDLAPLIEMCWQRRIVVALPVLAGKRMAFAAYRSETTLRDNRYGIPEPVAAPCGGEDSGEPLEPNVVLAPLVAFDDAGNRLGMGGGYYDRYFAAYPAALRVGVAHECQRAQRLPTNPWDVPLAALTTEKGWRNISVATTTAAAAATAAGKHEASDGK